MVTYTFAGKHLNEYPKKHCNRICTLHLKANKTYSITNSISHKHKTHNYDDYYLVYLLIAIDRHLPPPPPHTHPDSHL